MRPSNPQPQLMNHSERFTQIPSAPPAQVRAGARTTTGPQKCCTFLSLRSGARPHSAGSRSPRASRGGEQAAPSFRHWLHGYLVLQGNIPLRTSQFEHIAKLFATQRLGTRWAKYPFCRCRFLRSASSAHGAARFALRAFPRQDFGMCTVIDTSEGLLEILESAASAVPLARKRKAPRRALRPHSRGQFARIPRGGLKKGGCDNPKTLCSK